MIKIIHTDTLDSTPILEEIKKKYVPGTKHLLIVPDRFSMTYEREVMKYLSLKGTFDIQVESFIRLASRLVPLGDKEFLSPQAEAILMRKVIENRKNKLKCYKSNIKNPGFAHQMQVVVKQLRRSGIATDKMLEAIEDAPKKISDKLRDIALLYEGYISELQSQFVDETSKLEALRDIISSSEIGEWNIYISDWLDFTSIEFDIIKQLMYFAKSFTIAVVDRGGVSNERIYPKKMIDKLKQAVKESGNILEEDYKKRKLTSSLEILADNLFAYTGKVSDGMFDGVKIRSASSIREEVSNVAALIRKAVIEDGLRYKDIAIVCCDMPSYGDIIEKVFQKYNIKYYFDRKLPLSQTPVIRLIVSALKAAKGLKMRDVLRYSKEGLLPLTYEMRCDFETYVVKYGVDFNKFLKPFVLIDAFKDNKEEVKRASNAEIVREYIVNTLQPFKNATKTVKDIILAIKSYCSLIEIDVLNDKMTAQQNKIGYNKEAACAKQSLSRLYLLLDQSEKMIGNLKLDISDYLLFFQTSVASIMISTIPLYQDSVFVGGTRESRYIDVKQMYVVGASAGNFPSEYGVEGVLSDIEIKSLASKGLFVEPTAKQKNSNEKLKTLSLLLKAENLMISYSSRDQLGEKVQTSSTINEICELLNLKIEEFDNSPDSLKYLFGTRNNAEQCLLTDASKRNTDESGNVEIYNALYTILVEDEKIDNYLQDKSQDKFILNKSLIRDTSMSASRLERYLSCPFKYFTQYCLKLREEEKAQFELSDTGTIMHAVLEEFIGKYSKNDLSMEEIEKIVNEIFSKIMTQSEYAYLLILENQSLAIEELRYRCVFMVQELYKKGKTTNFKPYKQEVGFGVKNGDYKPIILHVGDKSIYLKGVIDRVDIYDDNIIIIDYKSKSSITFDLSSLIYGERIQLFLYFKAVLENEKKKPAGVFYMPMNNKFISKDSYRFRYTGFVNSDEEILNNIDTKLKNNDYYISELFPLQKNKNTIKGELYTTEELKILCDYAVKLSQQVCKELDGGFITPSPIEHACDYCMLKPVCGPNVSERSYLSKTELLKTEFIKNLLKRYREENDDENVE